MASSCQPPPTGPPGLLFPPSCPLPASVTDLVDALAAAAAALALREPSPAALVAAAAQAAHNAQAAQDAEEAAFELGRQLAARIADTRRALADLQALADELDAQGREAAAAAEAHTAAVEANAGKADRYVAQCAAAEAELQRRGFDPELSHVRLQARGRAAAKSSAELAAVQQQLERYCGLPADMDGAHSATQAKRAELQRLRAQLREHLDGLA